MPDKPSPAEFPAFESLWVIFSYITANWKTDCDMPQAQFNQALKWQVGLDKAYSAYYGATVTAFALQLKRHKGDVNAALKALYSDNEQPNPAEPDVAKVLGEFMQWNAAFGGFRAFGYQNYPGWMGNGNFEKEPPPYRVAPEAENHE